MCLILGIIFSLLTVQISTEECVTPNNEKAKCISLYSCPVLIGALATQQANAIEFVRHSNCGGTGSDPMVCCGSSVNYVIEKRNLANDTDKNRNDTQKINLLATKRHCGYQHSDDYFRTTNITATISEFPWLAKLVYNYRNPEAFGSLCTGSLINTRYVLTAAHCFHNKIYGKPIAVLLGEYHTKNKTDCVRELPFEQECSDAIETVGIEKVIPHPTFTGLNMNSDIGLLRLNRSVSYTEYVRPICLPVPGTTLAEVGDILTSSGWGLLGSYNNSYAEIKKKSLSTLVENELCALAYNSLRLNITKNHLCAIPVDNSPDVECSGDGGGPLLFSNINQWHQEGIISYGKKCEERYAAVYTRVANYLDWILENIEQ